MRDLPQDDDAMVRVDMHIEVGVPHGFKGWLSRKLLDIACWLGLDIRVVPVEQSMSRIGDLPQHVRDKLTAELLTNPERQRGFIIQENPDED